MADDTTARSITTADRAAIHRIEDEITEILTAMEEESIRTTDTTDTDIFADNTSEIEDVIPVVDEDPELEPEPEPELELELELESEPDPIITPAEATNDLEIDDDFEDLDGQPDPEGKPLIELELRILNKLLDRIDRVLRRSPNSLGLLTNQSHSLVLEGSEAMELNLTTSDTHFIHTRPNSYSFVHVHSGPLSGATPGRSDFSIINKGAGVLLLIMHNHVRGQETRWHKLLEPCQKLDLSIINDGNDIMLC
jgi:hypothetical protein